MFLSKPARNFDLFRGLQAFLGTGPLKAGHGSDLKTFLCNIAIDQLIAVVCIIAIEEYSMLQKQHHDHQ